MITIYLISTIIGLQGMISVALQAQNASTHSFQILTVEERFTNEYNPKKPYRSDLILETKNNIIIIELKRIRPNAISLPNHIEKSSWYVEDFDKLKQDLEKMNENELQQVEIFASQRNYYNKCKSVQQLLNQAKQQVKKYAKLKKQTTEKSKPKKSIITFVVIQVGWPLIVKEIK